MIERLNKCPLCKSGLFLNKQEIKDHAVSKESFILCKCSKCSLLFTNPRPDAESIAPYYDFPEYFSHEDKAKNLTQLIYQKVRNYSVKKKVKLISGLHEKGRLLDYGCGTGALLSEAKNQGWKISGVEPNSKARTQANLKLKGKVKETLDDLAKDKKFDIITLFHVLEHIHDMKKTVKSLVKHLKSGAYMIVAVPNPESWDANKYGTYWAGWDIPRHLYHFNKAAMENFAETFDLSLVEVTPMKFDSYYVSLLSEGYLEPNQNLLSRYFKAFLSGRKSNQEAKDKPGNHSSNLYIFKKK
jgi:2-polyprenyl-3-methyl-5-hydroxy-6-metoxy-1,4-benzoquinol methylase